MNDQVYGECGRHPGNNMVNCPLCSMDGRAPFPGTLTSLKVDPKAATVDAVAVNEHAANMAEARRLLSTLCLTTGPDNVVTAGNDTFISTGRLQMEWPDMHAAIGLFKRLNPHKHHTFPVTTYHLCVANWLVSAVCGTGQLKI